jgi:hypothetical protein
MMTFVQLYAMDIDNTYWNGLPRCESQLVRGVADLAGDSPHNLSKLGRFERLKAIPQPKSVSGFHQPHPQQSGLVLFFAPTGFGRQQQESIRPKQSAHFNRRASVKKASCAQLLLPQDFIYLSPFQQYDSISLGEFGLD